MHKGCSAPVVPPRGKKINHSTPAQAMAVCGHMAAVLMAAILPVSLLSGCHLFEMDPHEQLSGILTQTGNQIVGIDITERLEDSSTYITVHWVRDGKFVSSRVDDGELVTEDSNFVIASAGSVDVEEFSFDALVEDGKSVANKND